MELSDLLLYLARGALTAFDVIINSLERTDLESLRYISHEVGDLLVPYVFDGSDEVYVSAYPPDLNITHAVLHNPLLSCRVRKLTWDYSTIDHELLRYSWHKCKYESMLANGEWQGLCAFLSDHLHILTEGTDVALLHQALSSLPNLTSIRVANGNRFQTRGATTITLRRCEFVRSPTTLMFKGGIYTIDLLKPSPVAASSGFEPDGLQMSPQGRHTQPGQFRSLIYKGDGPVLHCCNWIVKASYDRIVALVSAMAQASTLQLQEFIASSSRGTESGKEEAWACALRKCSPDTISAWVSRFASVERLHLFMDDGGHIQTCPSDRHLLRDHIRLILQTTAMLEDLQITGVDCDIIAMMKRTNPRLRRLYVEKAKFKFASLRDFCRRHALSLQVLDIRNSQMTGGSWQRFVLYLQGGMDLPSHDFAPGTLTRAHGQTLDIRLHKVFANNCLPAYQGTRCVFHKQFVQRKTTLRLYLAYKDGCEWLVHLTLQPWCLPERLCRVHSDGNAVYPRPGGSVAENNWYGNFTVAEYR